MLVRCCWGATDRVLGLTRRLAACFKDSRNPAYTEHALEWRAKRPYRHQAA